MRKDWIRTEEERELRRLKNLNKEQRKLNKLSRIQQPIIDLPIVVRKKKRIIKAVKQELVMPKVEPVKKNIDFKFNFFVFLFSRFIE
jgi:hypothetical protein